MKNWEVKKLGEVYDVRDGTHDSPKYVNEGYALITSKNLKNDSLNYDNVNYITEQDYININKRSKVDVGDVLFAMIGTIGNPIVIKDEPDFAIKNVALFKVPENQDSYFLKYYLDSSIVIDKMSKDAKGATQKFVGLGYLRNFPIPLPPLPEQQRIVSILDEAFACIERSRNAAIKNLKNAKELFESYLQGVFENGNWETKTIEMVCDEIFAGGDAPKNNYSLEPNEKHNIPIYANAVKDRGLYGYTDFARVTKPCVTIAARGSGTGHTELRNEHFLPIVRLIVCIPDTEQISNEFLKYTIDNLVIQRSGSAIPQLTVPMIKDYKIPVPSIEKQKQIIEKTETLKQQKESLENVYFKKIEGLEELKKSILQKAFAGELRGGEPVEPKTEKALAL